LQPLDVTSETSLRAFGRFLALQPTGIDLAIHAAGLLHDHEIEPEKSLSQCNSRHLMRLFEVNSIGPLMVAGALLPTQGRNQRITFAALSAMVGSIGDNRLGIDDRSTLPGPANEKLEDILARDAIRPGRHSGHCRNPDSVFNSKLVDRKWRKKFIGLHRIKSFDFEVFKLSDKFCMIVITRLDGRNSGPVVGLCKLK